LLNSFGVLHRLEQGTFSEVRLLDIAPVTSLLFDVIVAGQSAAICSFNSMLEPAGITGPPSSLFRDGHTALDSSIVGKAQAGELEVVLLRLVHGRYEVQHTIHLAPAQSLNQGGQIRDTPGGQAADVGAAARASVFLSTPVESVSKCAPPCNSKMRKMHAGHAPTRVTDPRSFLVCRVSAAHAFTALVAWRYQGKRALRIAPREAVCDLAA
jgi:hypothetical protein